MLHPSKRGIICDLSGVDHLIKDDKLEYYVISIKNGNDNLLDLDITSDEMNKIFNKINKPVCKFCGSSDNVVATVLSKHIIAHSDHNDVDDGISFKICMNCFAELRQQVLNVVTKANDRIRNIKNEKPVRTNNG